MRRMCILLLFLSSCTFNKQPVISLARFQRADLGMSQEDLVIAYGPPNRVQCLDCGDVVYEYEERFQVGMTRRTLVQVRRYYFYVKDGYVISKQMRLYDRPGYEFEPGGELHWE